MEEKKLNTKQLEAVQYGAGPLLIIAGAGTGKTTVVTERIKWLVSQNLAKPSEILALTFTDKAAREMEERVDVAMPMGYTQMWISTFHAFCDRVLRNEAIYIGLDPKYNLLTEAETIQLLRSNLFQFKLKYFRPLGNPNKFIEGMLQHFSRLKDEDVSATEYLQWVQNQKEEREEIEKYLELAKAYQAYEELKLKEGVMDFSDLIANTLKLFRTRKNVLAQYQEQFKYILVDEFQDTNYAQYELLKVLAPPKTSPNLTVVGDDSQCLPAETKISTSRGEKRIDQIKTGETVLTAVGKGHTSFSMVLKVFKRKNKVRLITLVLEDGRKIRVTDNHKMFCYTPAVPLNKNYHFVYLMYQQSLGWRLGVTNDLASRLRIEHHADKIIGIGSYRTDQEARYYEVYYAARFGLPTVPFSPRERQAINGVWLKKLFGEIDTQKAAENLANYLHLELDSPHFMVGGVKRGVTERVKVNLQMCYRNYRSKTHKNGFVGNPLVSHAVWVETSSKKAIEALEKAGFILQAAKKGKRFRFTTSDLKEAWRVAERLVSITGGLLDKKFALGTINYQHKIARIVPASHILPGNYLPVVEEKRVIYKKVVNREEEEKNIEVYDLEVERTHNFVADGVIVHNSIYKFRGAAISNILQFMEEFKRAHQVVLTSNYRSTQTILDNAYKLIKHNDPDTLEAKLGISKNLKKMRKVREVPVEFIYTDRVENEAEEVANKIRQLKTEYSTLKYKDFAILVRANNHADAFTRALARHGIPYQFLGPGMLFRQPEVKDLIAYLKVLANFEDSVAMYRVLAMDIFEIIPRDLSAMTNYGKRHNLSLFEAGEQINKIFVSPKTRETVEKLVKMINRHLGLIKKETAGQILYYFLEESGLLRKITNYSTEAEEKRAQNISKFFDKLKTYEAEHEEASVFVVSDWIDLSLELGESPLAADMDWTEIEAVNLLTVHSSKGLEFPIVFLVNLVSNRFPTNERREQIPIPQDLIKEILPVGDYHLEEERRLFYVGMTRARDRLFLTAANYYGEGKRERKLSAFVVETLGDKVIKKLSHEEIENNQLSLLEWDKPQEVLITHNPQPTPVTYLTYSMIQTFENCPFHYKIKYILGLPTPPSAALSFGNSLHYTLRDFYRSALVEKRLDEKSLMELYQKNWLDEGYKDKKHEELTFEKGKRFLAEFYEQEKNLKHLPLAIELPFKFRLGDLTVAGKIDRIDPRENKNIEIIDYKTGASVPSQEEVDKDLQLSIYALAATQVSEKPLAKKPDEVILTLYYFETGDKLVTTRNKEQLKATSQTLLDYAQKISQSDFKCTKSEKCKTCEFKLLCEAWQ